MKFFCLAIFSTALVWAQAPAQPAKPTAPALPTTPAMAPDTVLATVEGRPLTYGEFEKYLRVLPPAMQQNAMRNRRQFVEQFFLMQRLAAMAEKDKLDERSPYQESITFNRMNILTQAEITQIYNQLPIPSEELQKFYDANKSRYQQVKLKVIYIPFTSNAAAGADGKKHYTEPEAKAKAEDLVKQIKGGADFVKLVQEYSEDTTSKAKDGDFGTISRSDNLPDEIRSVVFALKPGGVSDPVRQPNGFYVFRAEAFVEKPLADVQEQISNELKSIHLKQWMDQTTKSLNIKFENDQFFAKPAEPSRVPSLANPTSKNP
jgi:peptidyl-prolyl cis-trans isomerase C